MVSSNQNEYETWEKQMLILLINIYSIRCFKIDSKKLRLRKFIYKLH